ncbi:hypothetical protein L1987_88729 [Smallanthus sonchifolius]|nr:hypothetical protein L1987_88729 [Smallanthus sonchifolius]
MSSGTVNFPTILVTVTCNPRSSAGPPTTSLRPEGFIAQKRRDAGSRRGKPNECQMQSPHLIKIILAYSPKKERADPIEDESEVQQGHFCPPPFSRSRTWTLPLIQLPASKQLASLYKEWKCGTRMNPVIQDILILELMLSSGEGVFIERGKSRVASRLTDFSESEEDLSSDHPEHEGAALDVRSAAKERRKGP